METFDPQRHFPRRRGLELGSGAHNSVHAIKVDVRKQVEWGYLSWMRTIETLRMAVRQRLMIYVSGEAEARKELESEVAMWKRLKDAGAPVMETFCLAPDLKIYCTDLTEGGRNYVVSATNRSRDLEEISLRHAKGDFRQPAQDAQRLLEQTEAIALQLHGMGIRMVYPDALFLIADKRSRAARIMIGDYKHLEPQQPVDQELKAQNLSRSADALISRGYIAGLGAKDVRSFFAERG